MADFLKQLHTLLSNFSGSESGSHFADVLNISNFIFEELKRRSKQLIRPPHMGAKAADLGFLAEDAKLLLRCCLSAFRLLEFDLSLVVEVCEVLLVELGRVFECDIGRLDSGDVRVNHAFSTAVVEVILEYSATPPPFHVGYLCFRSLKFGSDTTMVSLYWKVTRGIKGFWFRTCLL